MAGQRFWIRDRLNEFHISGAELGRRVGVSRSYIAHFISGIRTPKYELAVKLAKELNVEPERFYNEKYQREV